MKRHERQASEWRRHTLWLLEPSVVSPVERCRSRCFASITVTMASSVMSISIPSSTQKVDAIELGSASPVVSTST